MGTSCTRDDASAEAIRHRKRNKGVDEAVAFLKEMAPAFSGMAPEAIREVIRERYRAVILDFPCHLYVNCRFLGTCEGSKEVFGFYLHKRGHIVIAVRPKCQQSPSPL